MGGQRGGCRRGTCPILHGARKAQGIRSIYWHKWPLGPALLYRGYIDKHNYVPHAAVFTQHLVKLRTPLVRDWLLLLFVSLYWSVLQTSVCQEVQHFCTLAEIHIRLVYSSSTKPITSNSWWSNTLTASLGGCFFFFFFFFFYLMPAPHI